MAPLTSMPGKATRPSLAGIIVPGRASTLAALLACGAAIAAWNACAQGRPTPAVVVFSLALVGLAWLAGSLTIGVLALERDGSVELVSALLLGIAEINVLLFVLFVALPVSLAVDAALIAVALPALFASVRRLAPRYAAPTRATLASLAALLLGLIGATLWSQASLRPVIAQGDVTAFRPWTDAFFHASWVSALRDAAGWQQVENNVLGDTPAYFFAFASYLLPAVLSALTGTSAYTAVTSFWTPLGLFLSAIAAFVLIRSWWGDVAGLGATAAVLLLPDASFYGLAHPLFGYHWSHVTHAASAWGEAFAALALYLTASGCRQGRWSPILAGWLLAGVVAFVKAQVFVAVALLVVLYACLFAKGWPRSLRGLVLVGLALAAVVGPELLGLLPGSPMLRIDGTGAKGYLLSMVREQPGGSSGCLLGSIAPEASRLEILVCGSSYLLRAAIGVASLGAIAVLLPLCLKRHGVTGEAMVPVLALGVFLFLSLGFSPNRSGLGTSDAMQHRQFPWAYFIVTAWIGGQLLAIVERAHGRLRAPLRIAAGCLVLAGLWFALREGESVHRGPRWGIDYTDRGFPTALVDSARFIREHSEPSALVQDSSLDRTLLLVALSERRSFLSAPLVIDFERFLPPLHHERTLELQALLDASDEDTVRRAARRLGIDFFVLHPDDHVAWPPSLLARPAFTASGYRVFHFSAPGAGGETARSPRP